MAGITAVAAILLLLVACLFFSCADAAPMPSYYDYGYSDQVHIESDGDIYFSYGGGMYH